jgi:hypothetical protein
MSSKRRLRFSLRALLILVTLAGLPFAWVQRARQQRANLEALLKSNPSADVEYDADSSQQRWPVDLLGIDYVANVTGATLLYPTDADLARLARFERLEWVVLERGIDMTDEGLRQVVSLRRLKRLVISDAEQISDAGLRQLAALTSLEYLQVDRGRHRIGRETLEFLRRALPKCRIEISEARDSVDVVKIVSPRSVTGG